MPNPIRKNSPRLAGSGMSAFPNPLFCQFVVKDASNPPSIASRITTISPIGEVKPGKPCFDYTMTVDGQDRQGTVMAGQVILEPLEVGQTATVQLAPARGVDLGEGRGRAVEADVHGGVVGVVFDGRGRPLVVPADNRSDIVNQWAQALDAYPK